MQLRMTVLAALALACSPAAFAGECNAKETESVGKTAATLIRSKVEAVTPVEGKEMLNISSCRTKGAGFEVKYKYNFMGGDGYHWVEGEGDINDGGGSIELKRVSDKLKDLAAAKNVVLAAR